MVKGMVVIDVDRCKGCGLCTHVCPANILTLSADTFNAKGYHPVTVTDMEACIGCASCARICPDIVFTIYRRKPVAKKAVGQAFQPTAVV
ncbi:MAG: 4Fe-4S dicluster domain-containing protein [Anaerolineae bacterium]|nr:4Fe-4S dicluster domain-containing protein [Anaerolineae bacterium]